jgi:hypothetical protein
MSMLEYCFKGYWGLKILRKAMWFLSLFELWGLCVCVCVCVCGGGGMGFELRASQFLGKHSITWAILSPLFSHFESMILCLWNVWKVPVRIMYVGRAWACIHITYTVTSCIMMGSCYEKSVVRPFVIVQTFYLRKPRWLQCHEAI